MGNPTLARRFACFARRADPPRAVLQAVSLKLLDTIGIGLAAHQLRHRPRIEEAVAGFGGGVATGFGLPGPVSAPAAALMNGCLAHALEADDTHTAAVMHGSCILVPACLATAEEVDADGPTLLRAIAAGWEVAIRIGFGFPDAFLKNGFHSTALAGPFASAVGSGMVRGLSEYQLVSAIGIAGSQSSGLFEFLADGNTSKWLHGGWPALAGMTAANMAAAGMSGPEAIFEGRAGFGRAFARNENGAQELARACDDLGLVWHCEDVASKLYPTCHFIQPFLECLEMLLRETAPEAITGLTCDVPAGAAALICEPWEDKLSPATPYQAKWSLPYCLASLLVYGKVDVGVFDRTTLDSRVLAAAATIGFEIAETSFPIRYPGRVTATTSDGSQRIAAVADVIGSRFRPLGAEQLKQKFMAYAGAALRPGGAENIIEAVDGLLAGGSARDLGQAIRAALRPSVPVQCPDRTVERARAELPPSP